ncbi:MAG: dihydroorotate dehydrogenase electron transfer subunit [Gammaproteobacteria bacterium]|jgi:dihydroorotate dehydrogenase electron transfer subunit|nr:dihydroorotate dehydrogenase electron transfer subunit [Gammaproteobacteria bacterium]MDP6617167.1 dihydroorotate dehydrogenase electron transfer subunit [Gammaproteobacteria bacterium]MDP6695376.1 dihydroorotate dehydrogenase electron transfer subunit [Gammaproteobacteria bacterium]MDP7042311.1 dihydroorotate dehydrogenase electron transfer subunit [Gammaproteobacteria bacterium]
MTKAQRDTIFVEEARVIEHQSFPAEQFVLRVEAPECARTAAAGSFAHIRCDADIPMRRPLSIMRADAETGVIDFLYKIVGAGLRALSHARPGDTLSIMGPIGNGFVPDDSKPNKLMIGGGVGIPPMVFLAEQLCANRGSEGLFVIMGSEVPFPFEKVPSQLDVAGIAPEVSDTMPFIESLGVPARLASLQGFDGCYKGFVTDLAHDWLKALDENNRNGAEIFACGPEPMLEATAKLAARFGIPCQLCLEEFMACAVGGCAGCAVQVHGEDGIAMKRVCVDGPVFPATAIYP